MIYISCMQYIKATYGCFIGWWYTCGCGMWCSCNDHSVGDSDSD